MVAIDLDSDIEIVIAPKALIARVPLAEEPGPWVGEYAALAKAADLPSEVTEEPNKMFLVVAIPLGASEPDSLLEASRDLIDCGAGTRERGDLNGATNSRLVAKTARQCRRRKLLNSE
jgi:hypothetical protein